MFRRRKRKRGSWEGDSVNFPDDVPAEFQKASATSTNASSSIFRAWQRCGEGFQASSNSEIHESSEKKKALKLLAPSLLSVEDGSEVIDWENASSPEGGYGPEVESVADPSDSNSNGTIGSSEHSLAFPVLESCKTVDDILEYSSDIETSQENERCAKFNEVSSATHHDAELRQNTERSASEWLKSAQELLRTPEKRSAKQLKTPEDSAKKRKKFLRGGLAERLNRLHSRERSSISFWRHQCVSDYRTPEGGKSGVLIVKVLQLQEECCMLVAFCQLLSQTASVNIGEDAFSASELKLTVMFTKETATHLRATPGDVIHIYPPWQKLVFKSSRSPIILNTHFSQKVLLKESTESNQEVLGTEKLVPGRKVLRPCLAHIFTLNEKGEHFNNTVEADKVTCADTLTSSSVILPSVASSRLLTSSRTFSDSLLEVIESQGVAGWREVCLRVVVQRIYCLPTRDGLGSQLFRTHPISFAGAGQPNERLCLLVQDAYGMFSEVQFQNCGLPEEGLEQYSKKWEGQCCFLSGMKVLQRTTRGRSPGLFSLIDSLWPPLIPLKVHGQSQDSQEVDGRVPAPSFCYILSSRPDGNCVEMVEDPEKQVLELYLPPVVHSLKTLLQNAGSAYRCSFNAQVIFKKLQVESGARCGPTAFSLYVTDPLLQNDAHLAPRILHVVVTSSCILGADVVDAFRNALPCIIFFKDAVRETDKIICVERTVLSLQWSKQYSIDGIDFTQMTGPVKLDELHSLTSTNSLCTVKGTVVGVDEETAFSWPACNRCGNGKLEESPGDKGLLYCRHCHQTVTEPVTKMQLEVFLQCPWPQHTVKVKLHEETIVSLLMSSTNDAGGYEVESVLGKEVGPLSCYVRSLVIHPSHWIGLEEIRLS